MGNPVVHFEIGCDNLEKVKEFYGSLFDWKLEPHGESVSIRTGTDVGGHFTRLGHEPRHYVTVYVRVEDVQAILDKAEKMGGKTVVPPMPVPGVGIFAWMQDPEGNVIGLIKETATQG